MKPAAWLVACAIGTALLPAPASAQTTPPSSDPQEVTERPHISRATNIANKLSGPLHPVVKGVASGGGIGAGVAYDFPERRGWRTTTEAVYTINGFWSVALNSRFDTPRAFVEPYLRLRDMSRLSFYGPGTHSLASERTHFGMRDGSVGIHGTYLISRWLRIGGRVEELWLDVSPTSSSRVPAIDTRFGERHAPGLGDQPRFGRAHAFVDVISPAGPAGARYQGGTTRVGYGRYADQQFDRYSFDRLDLETQQRFTLFGPHRTLTLHGWLSTTGTSAGDDVPFFLQHTLGGKGLLRSFGEYILGSDGTDATLRGFPTFRFRDRHLLLLQAEYRWPIWGPVDATVFMDMGKVTSRRRDLDLSDLKRSYGFSLGVVRSTGTVGRIDVGFGGGEGVHVFFGFGRVF